MQLFDGTVAENISRFDLEAPATKLYEAAQAADCLDLIQQLPDGFNTRIGVGGMHLSPDRSSVLASRALSTARRSWWFSMNPTPISTPAAKLR